MSITLVVMSNLLCVTYRIWRQLTYEYFVQVNRDTCVGFIRQMHAIRKKKCSRRNKQQFWAEHESFQSLNRVCPLTLMRKQRVYQDCSLVVHVCGSAAQEWLGRRFVDLPSICDFTRASHWHVLWPNVKNNLAFFGSDEKEPRNILWKLFCIVVKFLQ